jgi:hypothetical protein
VVYIPVLINPGSRFDSFKSRIPVKYVNPGFNQSPGCRGVEAVEPLSRRCRGLCRGLSRSVKADSMWVWCRGVEVCVEAVEAVEVSRCRGSPCPFCRGTMPICAYSSMAAKLLIPNTRSLVGVASACSSSPFAQASHGHNQRYAWQLCAMAASVRHKVQWCENLPVHFLLSRERMETNDRGDK